MTKALRRVLVALCTLVAAPMSGAGGIDDLDAGMRAHDQGKWEEALRLYTKAITSGELGGAKHADALRNRASLWSEYKKDFDRAIADLDEAIRLNPQDAVALAHRGSCWRNKKDFERAIADYSAAIRMNPQDTFPLNRRGLTYLLLGNYRAAIADYDRAIAIWPKDSHSLYGRGIARRMMGDKAGGEA